MGQMSPDVPMFWVVFLMHIQINVHYYEGLKGFLVGEMSPDVLTFLVV